LASERAEKQSLWRRPGIAYLGEADRGDAEGNDEFDIKSASRERVVADE
jgi:hypothetical protein